MSVAELGSQESRKEAALWCASILRLGVEDHLSRYTPACAVFLERRRGRGRSTDHRVAARSPCESESDRILAARSIGLQSSSHDSRSAPLTSRPATMSGDAGEDVFSSVHWSAPEAPKPSRGSELEGEPDHVSRPSHDEGDGRPAASTSSAAADRPFAPQRALSELELRPDGFIQVRRDPRSAGRYVLFDLRAHCADTVDFRRRSTSASRSRSSSKRKTPTSPTPSSARPRCPTTPPSRSPPAAAITTLSSCTTTSSKTLQPASCRPCPASIAWVRAL